LLTIDAQPYTDAEFVRRLYLDLWGRLSEPQQTQDFLADPVKDKRNRLVDQLLGFDYLEKPGHVDYQGPWLVEKPFLDKWTYLFGEVIKNCFGLICLRVHLGDAGQLPFKLYRFGRKISPLAQAAGG